MKARYRCAGAPGAATMFALLAAGGFGAGASAQTTVAVNDGQTLTEDALAAGMFSGQTFTLSPDLTFDINAGGVIGPVGDFSFDEHFNLININPFSFEGSTVNINNGGHFESHISIFSLVSNVNLNVFAGGAVGSSFVADFGSVVNISGGRVGGHFDALPGSVVNIAGGSVGSDFDAFTGSDVNISGGTVGSDFDAHSGSVVNITGGAVGHGFNADGGSVVNITGGSVGGGFFAHRDSSLNITGGEFHLNGAAISNLSTGFSGLFTGTLADGSVFIFSSSVGDRFHDGTTTLHSVALPPADTTPMVVSTGLGPKGLRTGQTLTLQGEGSLHDNFAAVSATLNIEGGAVVGAGLETAFSQVNITGGTVGDRFSALSETVVNIAGGSVGDFFSSFADNVVNITDGTVGSSFSANGSVVNITGGAVGGRFNANSGSVVNITGGTVGGLLTVRDSVMNISGGTVGDSFSASSGSVVNISSGTVGRNFQAFHGSDVNLFVKTLFINGAAIDLAPDETVLITQRGGALLQAILADGSFLDFALNGFASSAQSGRDFFATGATLTATRVVPTPGGVALLSLASLLLAPRRRREV